ncbi:MAG: hypothetical protein V9G11_08250 [Bifidobacterium adolescentis]
MMFMMPMPPTTSETPAMAPSRSGHGLGGGGGGLGEFLLVADGEVGLLAVAALLQEVGDILLDPGHHFRRLRPG